jgi:hypothetical protein
VARNDATATIPGDAKFWSVTQTALPVTQARLKETAKSPTGTAVMTQMTVVTQISEKAATPGRRTAPPR